MSGKRNAMYMLFCLSSIIAAGSSAGDLLLNGTNVHLVTGESYELYQGYILSLKSVSSDGSVWLQLKINDRIVKSDIVLNNGYFIYNKSNMTILSAKVHNVYSGTPEQNLVTLFPVYQFMDTDFPAPEITSITPDETKNPDNITFPRIHTPSEPVIWVVGIILLLILFYVLRKLW